MNRAALQDKSLIVTPFSCREFKGEIGEKLLKLPGRARAQPVLLAADAKTYQKTAGRQEKKKKW